ncbi:hypothetical protein CEXT_617931 [Caerostris extrusa]|uniref:Uncharacterized protein n=1 Tax=Caerostris extrusa TaxID=172846 RepID=A0AAV4MQ65_CAEEX|nr:hypothetical protein CEXT_617931 [Caerostris extrusa]
MGRKKKDWIEGKGCRRMSRLKGGGYFLPEIAFLSQPPFPLGNGKWRGGDRKGVRVHYAHARTRVPGQSSEKICKKLREIP